VGGGTNGIPRTWQCLAGFTRPVVPTSHLPAAASDVWFPALYGAVYVVVILVFAVMIFERRDFR